MGIGEILTLVFTFLPYAIKGVQDVFNFVLGVKMGGVKKALVMDAAANVVDAIIKVPGNSATAAQRQDILDTTSKTVDILVAGYNLVGAFTHSQPIALDAGPDK